VEAVAQTLRRRAVRKVATAVAVEAELVTLETHQTFLPQAGRLTPEAVVVEAVVLAVLVLLFFAIHRALES
jgi:hypothetical protein